MKTWIRSRGVATICGRCGASQADGVPVLVLEPKGLTRRLVRCQGCAGVPVDLEQIEAGDIRAEAAASNWNRFEFTGVTRNLFDAKAAAAGKDEA